MGKAEILSTIRETFFYGATDYTKNQPDLFVPHKFKMLAPSQVDDFMNNLNEGLTEKEILIYIHLPFCFSECSFCNSFPYRANHEVQKKYLASLLKELDIFTGYGVFKGKKAKGIYFGGGTPTSFSNGDLDRILTKISSVISLSSGCSITSEAHPLTLSDPERIVQMRDIGINRLSIGCQTFDKDLLKLCNRRNTKSQIAKIVNSAHDVGLSINIDMMTGLPGQSLGSVDRDLEILSKIKPDTVEYIRHEIVNPKVVKLYKENPHLMVDKDTLFEMVYRTQEWMTAHGYQQNGSFVDSRQWAYRYHWLHEMPIIAFGSRTRSYTKFTCYDKHEDISTYSSFLDKGILPIGRFISLSKKDQMYRSTLLRLQLKKGIDKKWFQEKFSLNPSDVFGSLFSKLTDLGCLEEENGAIRLTKHGAYFVEDVCDCIIDTALKEESESLVRSPHSEGTTSSMFD
ncbi:coproporphyrinogen III oxidase family protein [bacterium]|nr:coproporphyrinogen III oxidase family protein [bacterium]